MFANLSFLSGPENLINFCNEMHNCQNTVTADLLQFSLLNLLSIYNYKLHYKLRNIVELRH